MLLHVAKNLRTVRIVYLQKKWAWLANEANLLLSRASLVRRDAQDAASDHPFKGRGVRMIGMNGNCLNNFDGRLALEMKRDRNVLRGCWWDLDR